MRKPDNPTFVVERVKNTNVDLRWKIIPASGEVVIRLFLKLQKPRDVNLVNVASRKYDSAFSLADGFAKEYRATLPATLRLLHVDNTDEYV